MLSHKIPDRWVMSFTKGPWVLMPKDEFGFQIISLEVWDDALEQICNLENEADAQLISAAPELFEALKIAYMRIASDGSKIQQPVERDADRVILNIIEAAFTKAEGKSDEI